MLKKKPWSEIDNRVAKIVHRFALSQKLKIMGSNSFKGLHFPSDLDLASTIDDSAQVLSNHFQKLFSAPLPFIFVDFKAGHSESADDNLDGRLNNLKQVKTTACF